MTLHGHVFTAQAGTRGFDANVHIDAHAAAAFAAHGYKFCIRYVRRDPVNPRDITPDEAEWILDAGLGLMIVQHVDNEGWSPSGALGTQYGQTAAEETTNVGVPAGVTVWCDLEGVAGGTPAPDVVDFCNQWHAQVAAAGYVPGLYVGEGAGLNATQLYRTLRFTHYWGAYNLNADEAPIVRGLQMKQAAARASDRPDGFADEFQTDTVRQDGLGGLPTVLAPEGWAV